MRVPLATYRFQFHKGFTFRDAGALLPYLRDLGISDVYASPIFLAGPESTHGYDICGFDRINPNLGTQQDFEGFTAEIKKLGMGLLVDMVPNHMGIHATNCWWTDVLKNGINSNFSSYFDINWNPPNPLLKNKVLLPVLGDHYGAVLERGELKVVYSNGEFHLAYFDKHFPLSPESIAAFKLNQLSERDREPFLTQLNGTPGDAGSFDDLHKLIDLQHYRIAYWRTAAHHINYRRFFDVTELVSLRVEDEEVFLAAHKLLLELLRSGKISGVRIDHPDGMRDPKTYVERLQKHAGDDQYILAEKILSDDERLPEDWPIAGTTGYDYLIVQNGLFVRPENEGAFTGIYSRFAASDEDFSSLAYRSKQDMLNRMFIAEVNALTFRLKGLAASTRTGRDFTESELRSAIVDFIAAFPVYRTYVNASTSQLSPAERAFVEQALAEAKKRTTSPDTRALEFLSRLLSLNLPRDFDGERRDLAREFVIRLQQLSGPAIAKGLEDTAFYRYTRFVALNEVGGNPGRFGTTPEEFHRYNSHKQEKWPCSMLATSTHDTKRGEDTRARLNVLSEMPTEWEKAVLEWRSLNAPHRNQAAPSAPAEYLLYQVLVGTWTPSTDLPTYVERVQNYMLKAIREAKMETSWTEPNESYEKATQEFVAAIFNSPEFRASLTTFTEHVAFFGMFNSIAQVILKTCSPGVPDFYQGTEHWDLTLVDPDNRRPIDYALRQKLLAEVRTAKPADLLKNWQTGAIKAYTVANCLRIRRENSALQHSDYRAIQITGSKSSHMIAFSRTLGDSKMIVAVPRFIRTLAKGEQTYPSPELWSDTRLVHERGSFQNLLTGERLSDLTAANLFGTFPGAILKVV
ncbi:MAG TPA: malto-oligosyltrehalose synthase [Verrucomicrobiae bacterium]